MKRTMNASKMVTIRTITFEANDTADVAFSRIDWKVEKVLRLVNPLLGNSTTDTAKPWVGKIDREKKEFQIIQTAPFLSLRLLDYNFFPLHVHGKVFEHGHNSRISLRFRPALNTMLLFVVIYLLPILAFLPGGIDDWTNVLPGLVIPIVFTLLLFLQLNRTEKKLTDLFDQGASS